MWVLFDGGFVSIVQHRDKLGQLCVRARTRADLTRFLKVADSRAKVRELPSSDYRFRAVLPAKAVTKAMFSIVGEIDYDNFKARIAMKYGKPRAQIYGQVWSTLVKLQPTRIDEADAVP